MAIANAGEVRVKFAADTATFMRQMAGVQGSLRNLETGFQKFAGIARTAVSVFSVGLAINFIRSAAQAADELGKTADKLGLTTERMRTFQEAAEDAGVSQEALIKSLQQSQRILGDAAAGTGTAVKALERLGLSVRDLQTLSPDELFLKYADAIGTLNSRSDQFSAAQALFGRSAQEAFNLIRQGRPAIEAAAQDVRDFGLALSRVQIAQIENARRSFDDLGDATEVAGQRIAVSFAPFLDAIAEGLKNAGLSGDAFSATLDKIFATGFFAFEIMANGVNALQAAFFGLAAAIAAAFQTVTFGDLSESFAAAVDANLAKAQANLAQIQSIAEITERFVQILDTSKGKAEAFAAEQAAEQLALQQAAIEEAARAAAQAAADAATQAEILALQQRFELKLEITRNMEKEITAAIKEEQAARFQVAIESEDARVQAHIAAEQAIASQRQATFNAGIGLLQALASRSKTAAFALIAINRGLQIAHAIQNTAAGVTAVLADPTIPFYAKPAAVAWVKALGAVQVGLIAATGFAEARNVSGGGGLPLGSPHNPIFTSPTGEQAPFGATSQNAVQVIIAGNVGFDQRVMDEIIDGIREAIDDRDVIIFGPNSLQAQQIKVDD